MRTHIDWLTFTMRPRYVSTDGEGAVYDEYLQALSYALQDTFSDELATRAFGGQWTKQDRGRAPYKDSWRLGDKGITLFASPELPHCCIEISGQGCEYLITENVLTDVLECVMDRVTRIDIASDIETNVKPSEFVAHVHHERMRAGGSQRSETGETEYVGSQKSDRYARVYRYAPPHPRAHLLRIEHVFRRDYAKIVAARVVDESATSVVAAAGEAFGWSHPVWQVDAVETADISIVGEQRKANNTVFWLIKSCAPAFKRLVSEGEIRDPEAFLRTYFIDAST